MLSPAWMEVVEVEAMFYFLALVFALGAAVGIGQYFG